MSLENAFSIGFVIGWLTCLATILIGKFIEKRTRRQHVPLRHPIDYSQRF